MNDIIEDLNNSLMFNLSLSSKELFHSNFLTFLFRNYNDLFCKIVKETDFEFEVKREHKNIDIEIIGKNEKNYIIENKIKDILLQEQYKKINQLCVKDNYDGIFLFSLLGNNLDLYDDKRSEKNYWKEIGYERIIEVLRNYDYNNEYINIIVGDYCGFVENMILLLKEEFNNCNRYIFHYENDILRKLTKIRLHDVFIKYGMSLFVNYFKRHQYNDIKIDYGINRTMGTMSFYKEIQGTHVGIQIENTQYRKFSVSSIEERDQLEKNGWFDKNYRSSRNKHYLEYNDKEENKKFWYQIKEYDIKNMEFEKLSKLISKDLLFPFNESLVKGKNNVC
jgi:hypothetical protein